MLRVDGLRQFLGGLGVLVDREALPKLVATQEQAFETELKRQETKQ